MPAREWFGTPRRGVSLFLLVMAVPLAGLVWLSWRVLQQDRAVEEQGRQERCERAADLAVSSLQRFLGDLSLQLAGFAGALAAAQAPSDRLAFAVFDRETLVRTAGKRLIYSPSFPPSLEVPREVFRAAEAQEFAHRDLAGAIAAYRALTRSPNAAVRAGAWLRLGRCYRKASDLPKALEAYGGLEALGPTFVEGEPAELLARQARAALFLESGTNQDLQREASGIASGLSEGRWQIRRTAYIYLSGEVQRWLGREDAIRVSADAAALSVAVDSAWNDWRNGALPGALPQGRQTYWMDGRPALVLWDHTPERLILLAAGPEFLAKSYSQLFDRFAPDRVTLSLEDSDGRSVFGLTATDMRRRAIRTMSATGLPWTLYSMPAETAPNRLSSRGSLLLAGLAMTVLITLIGSYFISRAIARELAVARLQSDFVAAVSHDFRTPLTTLLQLTEMLVRGRVSSEERRQEFYTTLHEESRRLHNLVEGLLNFGRLEAREFRFQFVPLDLQTVVRKVVDEFHPMVAGSSHAIEFDPGAEAARIFGDGSALGRVFWNLLDNAVKYSPGQPTVWITLASSKGDCTVSVKDSGLGIPAAEQKEIFRKFVRGETARSQNIPGTGIGLSMALMIVEAHGGRIEVESEPGKGSTFRVVLPAAE